MKKYAQQRSAGVDQLIASRKEFWLHMGTVFGLLAMWCICSTTMIFCVYLTFLFHDDALSNNSVASSHYGPLIGYMISGWLTALWCFSEMKFQKLCVNEMKFQN